MDDTIRLAVFLGTLTVMLLCEQRWPKHTPGPLRVRRRLINLGFSISNSLLQRLLVGGIVYQTACVVAQTQWGLLHQLFLPTWADSAITLLVLDGLIYWQHRLFHKIPFLWRLHQVHHSDLEFDTTTAVRFHPLEIALSLAFKTTAVWLLGAHPATVLAFEILLNASALFNHGNIHIPERIDRCLRTVIVTPDMHRIHHSVRRSETDSNFGFSISIWDRCFGSYCSAPVDGQAGMSIGLPLLRDATRLSFIQLWLLPCRSLRGKP